MSNFPIRVIIHDDDPAALKWNVGLLARDPRTEVLAEAETPGELIERVRQAQARAAQFMRRSGRAKAPDSPDVILLDAEYRPAEPPLEALIGQLRALAPQALIVCLSQYGDPNAIQAACRAGAHGFLLKGEIRWAIAEAVTRVGPGWFVFTPGVEAALRPIHLANRPMRLPPWKPLDLSPRLDKTVWLCVMYGLSARLAALELGLTPETLERYLVDAADIARSTGADSPDMIRLLGGRVSRKDLIFTGFTQLPPA